MEINYAIPAMMTNIQVAVVGVVEKVSIIVPLPSYIFP